MGTEVGPEDSSEGNSDDKRHNVPAFQRRPPPRAPSNCYDVCKDGIAARYLTRHRISVGSATAVAAKHGIADHLMDLARVEGADLTYTPPCTNVKPVMRAK
jgi:hypothetical protein